MGGLLATAILSLIALATAALSTATGMGGGVLLFVSILHFFPLAVTIPVHGFVQMFANFMRAFAMRQHLVGAMCGPFLIGALFGVICISQVMQYIEGEIIPYSVVLALIVYSLFKPTRLPELKIPLWAFGIVGFVTGFLAILVGPVDPFLSPFFIRDDFSKEQVVANKSLMQSAIHISKLPVFLHMGFAYWDHLTLMSLLIAGSFAGIYIGIRLLSKVNRRFFLISYKSILFLVGIRIAVRLFNLITAG